MRIGCAILLPCPACGTSNGLDTSDRPTTPCRACQAEIPFSDSLKDREIHVCYTYLRNGKAAITKDTEFGMVSWEQAFQGITHGVPGLETTEFELVPIDPAEDWFGVRVPKEHLFELLRTPTYGTWQGERWLFCCQRPMTYMGGWTNVLQSPLRPDDARAFFKEVIDSDDESKEWLWEALERGSGGVCLYVFRCKTCDRFRGHWDMD